jgi:tripartite-type tricarboxylate transporter receptor subunit TctC
MRVGRFAFALGFFVELLIPLLLPGCAQETSYPQRPIHIVVPHDPGGVVDTSARLIQPYLQKYLGVPVVINNMPGAGGNIGRVYVFRQPPDGHTLMVNLQPSMSAGQILTGARFDSLQFTHVYNITGHNYDAVAVPVGSPLKTIEDLRKASQTRPLTAAGGGIGTTNYILAMLLKEKAGVQITFVPFNSGAETALAVSGGQTQMGIAALDSVWPLYQSKRLRILAVAGPERDPSHPEFPSLVELGYPDIQFDTMAGLYAPPGLSQQKLSILVAAMRKVFADDTFLAAANQAGISLRPLEPAEFLKVSSEVFSMVKGMENVLKP